MVLLCILVFYIVHQIYVFECHLILQFDQVEFERASVLYKPLTTSMSSRFVSAGTSQEVENVGERSNDSTKAAKLKLFGSLTREKVEWHPAKLLCIRFNVKHPYGDHSVIGVPSSYKSKFDIFGRLDDKVCFGNDPFIFTFIDTKTIKKVVVFAQ